VQKNTNTVRFTKQDGTKYEFKYVSFDVKQLTQADVNNFIDDRLGPIGTAKLFYSQLNVIEGGKQGVCSYETADTAESNFYKDGVEVSVGGKLVPFDFGKFGQQGKTMMTQPLVYINKTTPDGKTSAIDVGPNPYDDINGKGSAGGGVSFQWSTKGTLDGQGNVTGATFEGLTWKGVDATKVNLPAKKIK
jgi:hypothetical protein